MFRYLARYLTGLTFVDHKLFSFDHRLKQNFEIEWVRRVQSVKPVVFKNLPCVDVRFD